jgi:hypothetical protein
MLILWEALLFFWAYRDRRRPWRINGHYLLWRLGTVYGIHPNNDGTKPPKTLGEFMKELWTDRRQVTRFLRWRRTMRRLSR